MQPTFQSKKGAFKQKVLELPVKRQPLAQPASVFPPSQHRRYLNISHSRATVNEIERKDECAVVFIAFGAFMTYSSIGGYISIMTFSNPKYRQFKSLNCLKISKNVAKEQQCSWVYTVSQPASQLPYTF